MVSIFICIVKSILILTLGLFFLIVLIVRCAKFYLNNKKGKCTCTTLLPGKVALITGGNSGIGLEIARNLAKRGASVIIASRNIEKSKEAVEDIIRTTGNINVEYRYLNLGELSSVREFAKEFDNEIKRLDILVINAGCAGLQERLTEDKINITIQINYVAQFLLTNLLLDKLIKSKPSRIVIVSSDLHKRINFNPDDIAGTSGVIKSKHHSYIKSKLLQVLWAKALAIKLPKEVIVNVSCPGAVKTHIFDRFDTWRKKILFFFIEVLFKTPEEGAQTAIHLCVSPNINSGDYYVDCKLSKAAKEASNKELISKVWDETMKLTSNNFKEI